MAKGKGVGIICPFYVSDSSEYITCEGFTDGCNYCQFRFKNKAEKLRHQDIFCNTYKYENCEIYRMIYEGRYSEDN